MDQVGERVAGTLLESGAAGRVVTKLERKRLI
jgi:hypothetical protein